MYKDDCRLKGVVNLVLRDKDGKVKQHKTIRNKVTDYGIAHMIGRMIDDNQDKNACRIEVTYYGFDLYADRDTWQKYAMNMVADMNRLNSVLEPFYSKL